jgi:hypothetical protein
MKTSARSTMPSSIGIGTSQSMRKLPSSPVIPAAVAE